MKANKDNAFLASLFAEYEREVAACFDWLKGELTDDAQELSDILSEHTLAAGAEHFNIKVATGKNPSDRTSAKLVLGAPLPEHLDKVKSDLLFRLRAETRKAVEAGCTAAETVRRLGLNTNSEKISSKLVVQAGDVPCGTIHAALDPLAAISIGIRLFDTTDNSIMKFIQAAVTELASDADAESFDAMGDDAPRMGWTWVSAADGRVCDFCEYMDGGTWDENKEPIGDSPELEVEPAAHFGCRCALISCDLDDDAPSGNFESYLSRFSNEEQTQAFGPTALKEYRAGRLSPAGLMGQQDNEITLESFRKMEPRLEIDLDKYRRMGAAEGGRGILEQRAMTTAEQLGIAK